MHIWHRAILAMLVLTALLIAWPGFVYVIGLAKVHSRPTPADPTIFSPEAISTAWLQCGEELPIAVGVANPWQVAGTLLFDDPRRASAGERAAWQIASTHNASHPVSSNLWWHTSGTALSIWITRHWSAEQVGATLVRDNLCK